MKYPNFSELQFLDAAGVGGLNAAVAALTGSIASVGSGIWTAPGLIAPETMGLTFSGMVGTATLPAPWGLVSSGGIVIRAHGTQTGANSTSYSANFAPFVPGSGSVTAYLAATIALIQQDSYALTGAPPGHPSFNPNFEPTNAYATNVYSVALSAVTGGIDNVNTFELARISLSPGQTGIASYSAAGWARAADFKTRPVTVLPSGGVLTVAQAQQALAPSTSGLTHTVPSVSTAGGLDYFFVNPQASGAWTIAASGSNTITGLGLTPVSSVSIPAYGTLQLWGNAVSGIWEVAAVNPLMMASIANAWTAPQTINDPGNPALPLTLTGFTSNGVSLKLVGNGSTTPSKTIRVVNGQLGIINDAGNTFVFQIDDLGNLSIAGQENCASLFASNTVNAVAGMFSSNGGVTSSGFDNGGMSFRSAFGAYGAGWRNDGNNYFLVLTASGSPNGGFNSFRPFSVGLANGQVFIDGTGAGTQFGGNVQATSYTGLTLNVGGVVFPGAGAINSGPINSTDLISGAQVQAYNGNVTATNGRLRAFLGALNTGDGNAATLLLDYIDDWNSYPAGGYQIFPNGLIIQWMTINAPPSSPQSFLLPIVFPHNHMMDMICYQNNTPPAAGVGIGPNGLGGVTVYNAATGTSNGCNVIAIGF